MSKPNNPCWKCYGTGSLCTLVTPCEDVDAGRFCETHYQHFDYKRCWLCRGSRRMDVFSAFFVNLWRKIRG